MSRKHSVADAPRGRFRSGIPVRANATLPILRRAMLAAAVVGILGGAGCSAGSEADDSGARPASGATMSDSADLDRPPDDATGAEAEAPVDERAAGAGAVMGAQWTAGDTEQERTVEGAALLVAIRAARNEGFDRIVLDFGEDPVPSYRVAYIDRPVRQCGSGNTVELAGDGWLSITVQPANAHTEAGVPTVTPRDRKLRLPGLLELRMVCDFEAVVEVVAGVRSPERYRAFVLASPNRLVVDIEHSGG